MKRTCVLAFLALSALATSASATGRASDLELIEQLSVQPFAEVVGDRCEIRGAVWADGPRAGVRIGLIAADGQIHEATTNRAGIYALSVPMTSNPTFYAERVLDEVRVPDALFDQVRINAPMVACIAPATSTNKENPQ